MAMSRPRHKWYGEIKRRILEGKWQEPESFQDYLLMKAIYEADKETIKLPNGDERMKVIKIVMIDHKSYTQAEFETYNSTRNIQRWITSYINLVGKKAGY